MSDVLIKGMELPKDCEECQIATVKSYSTWCPLKKCHIKKGYSFRDCPLVELPDSSWHTETPTEGGWYLTKVTDVDKPYEVLKFENGKWSDYLDYDDVPEVVNDSFVLAYQKIEPFKEDTV